MSMYQLLGLQPPAIAYTILHRSGGGLLEDEYTQRMADLHKKIRAESDVLAAHLAKTRAEIAAREAQMLFGGLSEFLETPLQSDREQITRIVHDTCTRLTNQLVGIDRPGVAWTSEGRITAGTAKKQVEKKLLLNGREMLRDIGLADDGNEGVYESQFVVTGGANLDVLEHIVRDKLGIYAAPHGDHVLSTAAYRFSAYNLLFHRGALPPVIAVDMTELALYFEKPKVKYDVFRQGLEHAVDEVVKTVPLAHCSIWQRKLGLGRTKEFVLRCLCSDPRQEEEVVRLLHEYRNEDFISPALTTTGALLVKQPLF